MPVLSAVLVARSPQPNGPPDLVELDRLVTDSISYTDELNRPGSATVTCKVGALSSVVRERLADLRNASEVWVYLDSRVAWAGSVQSLRIQAQTVTLNCVGLLGYCSRMGITADTTFTATDQLTIARTLVSAWQGQPYGHYGIEAPGSGTSGVLRDRTYLRGDLKNVGSALSELGAVIDGFDMHVRPDTRALVLSYPRRGDDLSEVTVLDARSIDSADVVQSVEPDDLASDFAAASSAQVAGGEQVSLYSYRTNLAVQTAFGRAWRGQSFSDISVQATLDDRADAYLQTRAAQFLQPGVTLVPNPGTGTEIGAFGPGDVVAYAFDAGLGLQAGTYRVAKVAVTVGGDGAQRLGVEFT